MKNLYHTFCMLVMRLRSGDKFPCYGVRMNELNSEQLILRTKCLVTEERLATLSLIEHLEEISRRMLYAKLGYSSLWDFFTRELGLSEGAAQRRIQAMRLLRDVPEAKASLESGKLSPSNAAKVQSFRQAEKKMGRQPDAKQLVVQVESLSQRQCEAKLFEISPQALPREQERIVSAKDERELKFLVSPQLYEKLQRLKALLAHSKPEASYAELLEYLADESLARLAKRKAVVTKAGNHDEATAAAAVTGASAEGSGKFALQVRALPVGKRVYLPVALRRAVLMRSGGPCEYQNEGRSCTSRYRIEIDHRRPLAKGGANTFENLRSLCWHHNRQQALEKGCGWWRDAGQANPYEED
jgi:hypothetical protein